MDNDLIDDTGLELGMPTQLEMLQHYNCLLEAELYTTRSELQRAHKSIAGLIVMYRDSSKELAVLKLEYERLKGTLSDVSRRGSENTASTLTYAYGDYSNRSDKP
jgi:hypothetical protein